MEIDKAWVEEQIIQLKAQKTEALTTANAIEGAIQQCQHILNVLDMEEPPDDDRTSNEKGEKHGMAEGKETGDKRKAS